MVGDVVGNILGKGKRPCKYCGQVHTHCPFTDCHDPKQPIPDDLQSAYKSFGYEDNDEY